MMRTINVVLFIITLSIIFSCKDDDEPKVKNSPPDVQIEGDPASLTLQVGNQVSLDASKSEDLEGKDLIFGWELISQPTGSTITLVNTKLPTLSFKPTHPGQYKIKLSCSDGEETTVKEVIITANAASVTFPENISTNIDIDKVLENINPTPGEPDYIVTKSINVNGRLTIKPGVVIKMAANSELFFSPSGEIIAIGTKTQHIVFVGPGNSAPDWKGVTISSSSSENELDYVEIHNAGNGFNTGLSNLSASLALDGANAAKLKIGNTLISKGGGYGIYVENNASFVNAHHLEIKGNLGTSMAVPINQIGNFGFGNRPSGNNGYDAVEVIGSEINSTSETVWEGFEDLTRYYITGDLMVRSGLRIFPGVTMEFASEKVMQIQGNEAYIFADGTAEYPIHFQGKTKTKGFWEGISISSNNDKNKFQYAEISHAGSGFLPNLSNTAASLGIDGDNLSKVSFINSIISEGSGYGLLLEQGATFTEFTKNEFKNIDGTPVSLPANEVSKLDAISKFSIGNKLPVVEIIGSTLNRPNEVLWIALPDGTKYFVNGDLEVRSALKIEAGAVFEFDSNKSLIVHRDNNSYIRAIGTEGKRIVFTGKNKTKGYWKGVSIISNSDMNIFYYVEISNGGSGFLTGLTNTTANLGLDGDNSAYLEITNCVIKDGAGWGLAYEAGVDINPDFKTTNTFTSNNSGAYKIP